MVPPVASCATATTWMLSARSRCWFSPGRASELMTSKNMGCAPSHGELPLTHAPSRDQPRPGVDCEQDVAVDTDDGDRLVFTDLGESRGRGSKRRHLHAGGREIDAQ